MAATGAFAILFAVLVIVGGLWRRSATEARRAEAAYRRLRDCDLCARYCRVDRLETLKGAICRTGELARGEGALAMLDAGDKISLDNSAFLAAQTYHRHQVPGPDFPTAAVINGARGIREAYRTGRGRIYIRARSHVEGDDAKGRQKIVFTELQERAEAEVARLREIEEQRLTDEAVQRALQAQQAADLARLERELAAAGTCDVRVLTWY